jgi:hypothetical protein
MYYWSRVFDALHQSCFSHPKNSPAAHIHDNIAKVDHHPFQEIFLRLPTAMANQQRVSGIYARVQSLVDRVISPATRKQYYDKTTAFAQEQPLLFVSYSSTHRSNAG